MKTKIELGKSVQISVWSSVDRSVDTSLWRPITDSTRWRLKL